MAVSGGESQIRIIFAELIRMRAWIAFAFLVISLSCLIAGLFIPKSFTSSTTILAEREDVLAPLMAGRAVSTATQADDTDRVRLYRERLYNRDVLLQVATEAKWITPAIGAVEQEVILGRLAEQTTLDDIGPNLIRIEVSDGDAQRAFHTARLFGDQLISESERVRREEIVGAFDFIDRQAEEYHQKLLISEQHLKEYRASNVDVSAGTTSAVTGRVSELQNVVEKVRMELNDSRIRERELEQQLSGETRAIINETRASQYRTLISELQAQLETLRLSYHDTYPEIVTIKYKIADIESALDSELRRAEKSESGSKDSEKVTANNPLYESLRKQLSQIRADSLALTSRLAENRRLLSVEIQRAKRIPEIEATLAELNRDYDVNNNVYQDLLSRRENARVSMNMELETGGQSFRVLDPAMLPLVPKGLRLLHLALLGPLLGIAFPVGILVFLMRIDPRFRDASEIAQELGIETIGFIGELSTPQLRKRNAMSAGLSCAMVVVVVCTYGFVGWMRFAEEPFMLFMN